ncbi:conserved hypothetical protein [Planktothrix sp. PCC 11201]|uniref:helix-turn-helix domain-containing protein n=1 Tax=Planktothrix sp. PCC 11201 TaxID=1729650 RepID=UPI000919FA33|nr:helix-turn-helix domain-containing protein [Planktothrix sp. PCC 11201]SKB14578.1 conserved hypothetical protein [Planktothrix sp. PCC 11201]
MQLNPVNGFGMTAPTTAEVSPEGLRSLVRQIEAELYCSEVYNIALKSLQKMLGQAASKAEIVIKAVGREAIQLSLKQIARQETAIISTLSSAANHSISVTAIPSNDSDSSTPTEIQTVVVSPLGLVAGYQAPDLTVESPEKTPGVSESDNIPKTKTKNKPQNQAEINHQIQEKQKIYLQEIGIELRNARESYSLTLQQMHYFTLVPLHHLEALEQGKLEALPEDIYIRGFIYRVANALGLEGGKMASSFPCLEFNQPVGKSNSKVDVDSEFYLNSAHLYLGYAAILASSMGGVAWLSQQSVPDVTLPPDIQNLLEQQVPQSRHQEPTNPIPGRQSQTHDIQISSDFSPPEMMEVATS